MNIYFGPTKAKAKKITLKELVLYTLNIGNKKSEITQGRHIDDSASWVEVRQFDDKHVGAIDITIYFDTETDNIINELAVHKSLFKLDEQAMTKVI